VLGNGNLGHTTLTARRGERRGGATWRLVKKARAGERGKEGKGKGEPKVTRVAGGGEKDGEEEKGVRSGGGGGPVAL
jgi:hypothetical protein